MQGVVVAEKSCSVGISSSPLLSSSSNLRSCRLVQRSSVSRQKAASREPYDYEQKLKKHQAQRLVLRRALLPAPPLRNNKQAMRWLNFRPSPSRLSRMSPA
ncbi:hypothetical protein QQ045_001078 [Rhodiola kirilowii]